MTVNPLVKSLKPGKATLVQIKYDSDFRDLTHASLEAALNPKKGADQNLPPGIVSVNKSLKKKIEARKNTEAEAAPVDPKAKKGAPPPAPKKEDPPKKDAKGAKGAPTAEEEQAELERKQKEAEEAARKA